MIGEETKDLIKTNFKLMFDYFNRVSVEGGGNPFTGNEFKPCRVSVPADMSTH